MKKRGIVIFSGYNQRAVIAFLRTINKKNIPYGIIAKSTQDTIFLTEYKKKVLATRSVQHLELIELSNVLQKAKEKLKVDKLIIAPSTEALNRFILKFRIDFERKGFTIPIVDSKNYNLISDKYLFSNLCKENNIVIPKEYQFIQIAPLPFVAKPKFYFSSKSNITLSPILIETEQEKQKFIDDYNIDDFYFQQYVFGNSKYLLYYFHRDGTVFKFSQENLVQQPEGKSMVVAVSSDFHLSEESIKYEQLFKKTSFFGFVMVEVKGEKYMIEANPRFWGPSQLFVDAGVNLFDAWLHDLGLIEKKPNPVYDLKTKTYYCWFGGLMNVLRINKKLMYHNYKVNDLVDDMPALLKTDIYRRKDTLDIFKHEINL